jgi:hypothetical protein
MAAGKVREGAPLGLAQAKGAKALIEFVPPNPAGFLDELTNFLGVDFEHR